MQITSPAPEATPPQAAPTAPVIATQSIPNWVIYLMGALVLTIVFTLVIIFTLVLRTRRF